MNRGAAPEAYARLIDLDHAALRASALDGVALCTIIGIDGSFSRRRGAQIAILPDGSVVGDLADTCLERELSTVAAGVSAPLIKRYGQGSPVIDFRLPCGSGLDILIDPSPDRAAAREALDNLEARRPASLALAPNPLLPLRRYVPSLQIIAYGEGAELAWLTKLCGAAGVCIEAVDKCKLALGRVPDFPPADGWTAVVLLFHDHEWEVPLLAHALGGDAFYIGAQGGAKARASRLHALKEIGFDDNQLARVQSPVGAIAGSRTPQFLALAALNDIVSRYERLHPHG